MNGLVVLADATMPAGVDDVGTALTSVLTSSNLSTILAYAVGLCAGLVLFWWAIRKVGGMFMRAFKKGKLRL